VYPQNGGGRLFGSLRAVNFLARAWRFFPRADRSLQGDELSPRHVTAVQCLPANNEFVFVQLVGRLKRDQNLTNIPSNFESASKVSLNLRQLLAKILERFAENGIEVV
jgi:hypothetical protein